MNHPKKPIRVIPPAISAGASTAPKPQDPTLLGTAREAMNWLNNLEGEVGYTRAKLVGPSEPGPAAQNTENLEIMLTQLCGRLASLVGEVRTINALLGE